MTIYTNAIGGDHQGPTFIVAASGSLHPERADYVCDGVDDDVEIQAAIDALTSGRTNKERVLCVGNFILGENINLPSYTILELDGSLKVKDSFGYPGAIVVSWHSQLWEIIGGEIDGNKANVVGAVSGVVVRGATGAFEYHDPFGMIKDVNVGNCTQDGFEINSRRCHVTNCIAADNDRYGFYITTSDGLYIGCSTLLNGDDGFNITNSHNHFIDCFSDRDGGDGFQITNHDNVIIGGYAEWSGGVGIKLGSADAYRTTIRDVRIISNDSYGIYVASNYNIIDGNVIYDNQGVPTQNWGVFIFTGDRNIVINNNVINNSPGQTIYDSGTGTNSIIRNNIGFVTENSGTDTIAAAQTSKVVTHGLAVTPSAGDIMVTSMESLGNASFFWIDTYTATQFTIHTNVAPGADTDFAWKAIVL